MNIDIARGHINQRPRRLHCLASLPLITYTSPTCRYKRPRTNQEYVRSLLFRLCQTPCSGHAPQWAHCTPSTPHLNKTSVFSATTFLDGTVECIIASGIHRDIVTASTSVLTPSVVPSLARSINQSHGPTVDRKSTRLNSSHSGESRMPSSA